MVRRDNSINTETRDTFPDLVRPAMTLLLLTSVLGRLSTHITMNAWPDDTDDTTDTEKIQTRGVQVKRGGTHEQGFVC